MPFEIMKWFTIQNSAASLASVVFMCRSGVRNCVIDFAYCCKKFALL